MAGIFYNPQVHNKGSALAEGVMTGLRAMQMKKNLDLADVQQKRGEQELEGGGLANRAAKIATERAEKVQQAEKEIADYETGAIEKIRGNLPKQPNADVAPGFSSTKFQTPLANAAMRFGGNNEASATPLAVAATPFKEKTPQELQKENIGTAVDVTNHAFKVYMKHGLTDKAQAIKSQHIQDLHNIAGVVGVEGAFEMLKKGPFADEFKDTTLVPDQKGRFSLQVRDNVIAVLDTKTGKVDIQENSKPAKTFQHIVQAGTGRAGESQATVVTTDDQGNVLKQAPVGGVKVDHKPGGKEFAPSDTEKKFNFWKSLYPNLSKEEIEKKVVKEDIPSETRYVLDAVREARRNGLEDVKAAEEDARTLYKKLTGTTEAGPTPGTAGKTPVRDLTKATGQSPVARAAAPAKAQPAAAPTAAPKDGEIRTARDGNNYKWDAKSQSWLKEVKAAQREESAAFDPAAVRKKYGAEATRSVSPLLQAIIDRQKMAQPRRKGPSTWDTLNQ
ncbi:MAG: hypothetical protein LLG06_19845 [Desulfobacteraceae bacterium]|nr:hypothetical protein [Desulfobacteraceae bacterium]